MLYKGPPIRTFMLSIDEQVKGSCEFLVTLFKLHPLVIDRVSAGEYQVTGQQPAVMAVLDKYPEVVKNCQVAG
jgi:hypothetical protein